MLSINVVSQTTSLRNLKVTGIVGNVTSLQPGIVEFVTMPGFLELQFVLLHVQGNKLKQIAKLCGQNFKINISLKLQLSSLERCDVANHSSNFKVSQ